jgi:hypothetical protein
VRRGRGRREGGHRQLNPIIRNAMFTALRALMDRSQAAKDFVAWSMRMIPTYWEAPELLESYAKGIQAERGE